MQVTLQALNVIQDELSVSEAEVVAEDAERDRSRSLWSKKAVAREKWLRGKGWRPKSLQPLQKCRRSACFTVSIAENVHSDLVDDAAVTSEVVEVQVPRVQLVFEVEHLNFNVPRISMRLGLLATIKNWSTQVVTLE